MHRRNHALTTPRRPSLPVMALAITFAVALMCVAGCGSASDAATKIEEKTVPLMLTQNPDTDAEEREIKLYYMDGGDVPYVAVSEFLPLFGSLYEDTSFGMPALDFSYEDVNGVLWATRKDNESPMLVDPQTDTIEFVDFDSFTQFPGNTALVPLVTIGSTGFGGSMKLLKDAGSYDRYGLETTFDLSDYDIDIVGANGEAYVPLQTMHDILLASNYYFTVYTGEKVFVFSYGCYPSDQIEAAPTAHMSESYASFNYNELIFLLDHFYGLKPEHGIDSFKRFILNTGLIDKLSSTDPDEFDLGLAELTMRYLDDQHSGFSAYSYRSERRDEDTEKTQAMLDELSGASGAAITRSMDLFAQNRATYYPELPQNPFLYEEVGDTAIITFDSFYVGKRDYYADADLDNPQDTIELIAAAHKAITREGSPIKNVVIDLSHNGGGDSDAAAFVIAWYGGSGQLGLRQTLTGAQSVVSYQADVNLDGKVDENDSLAKKMQAGELNLYCLTSANSFSCGNLVPAAFKGSGVVLIGQATGGGSCVVMPCTTASGTLFSISGTTQISTVKNGSFYNADTGIEPDVPITKFETYYDRAQLVDFIHSIK